jgi:hypothetical protein
MIPDLARHKLPNRSAVGTNGWTFCVANGLRDGLRRHGLMNLCIVAKGVIVPQLMPKINEEG